MDSLNSNPIPTLSTLRNRNNTLSSEIRSLLNTSLYLSKINTGNSLSELNYTADLRRGSISNLWIKLIELNSSYVIPIKNNSSSIHFSYKGILVNIFSNEGSSYLTNYYTYGLTYRFLAIIASKLGLKLDTKGLHLPVIIEGNLIEELTISSIYHEISHTLGASTSYPGNRIPEQLYFPDNFDMHSNLAVIVNSRYFDPSYFNRENCILPEDVLYTNVLGNALLQYISNENCASRDTLSDRDEIIVDVLNDRYELKIKLKSILETYNFNKVITNKFNPTLVSSITNITKDNLDLFIQDFKSEFKDADNFEAYLLSSSPYTIAAKLKDYKSKWMSGKFEAIYLEV